MDVSRFAGVGLVNALIIAVMTMFIIVGAKIVLTKYPVAGLSEIIQTV